MDNPAGLSTESGAAVSTRHERNKDIDMLQVQQ
ncbi:MAG TPA: ABC transporter ATP-binding protein, partial [Pseudomonas sp.]|nr:ABC transporter ATP-binding protein [Pseudomonas sp.]